MSFSFTLLPIELRRLVYGHLITAQTERSRIGPQGALVVDANCGVPAVFLLVSKRFSCELLSVLSTVREVKVKVEASSAHSASDHLLASWPRLNVGGARRLLVHMQDTSQQQYRMQWRQQYTGTGPAVVAREMLGLLSRASTHSSLRCFVVVIDSPSLARAGSLLDCLGKSVGMIATRDTMATTHTKDRWNGFACTVVSDCAFTFTHSYATVLNSPTRCI
jgi:hypothetical protein